jgi:hypothetical protein
MRRMRAPGAFVFESTFTDQDNPKRQMADPLWAGLPGRSDATLGYAIGPRWYAGYCELMSGLRWYYTVLNGTSMHALR